MIIDLENLFLQKIKDGINLFTGAGFSVLPSDTGEKLPTAKELCSELIKKYSLKDVSSDQGLAYISEFCPEQEYQSYLRNRFTVSTYNHLYNVLNKINLKTYVSTNIDNIIRLVMDNSTSYYLKNIREYGASMNGTNELSYIPLHGDVNDLNSKLYFGEFDLSIVDKQNSDLFDQMFGRLAKQPILFWGYSFKDKGVLSAVKRLLELGSSDIWIQFLPTEVSSIKLFRDKGCHIIEADTESLLRWIDAKLLSKNEIKSDTVLDDRLKQYRIPTISEITSVPQSEYFQDGNTCWHPILANVPFERLIISVIEDSAIKNQNIILTGCKFSGKTTILMQLARKINSHNKLYVDGISKEEAEFIINIIQNKDAWIFFNNFTDDIMSFNCFAKHPNIRVIGASDDYHFETVKHLIDRNVSYKLFDCSEIHKTEAQNIFNKIPVGIKTDHFIFKDSDDEKYSMLELVSKNVYGAQIKQQVSKMLSQLKKNDYCSFQIIALTVYLIDCRSAISYTNIANFFDVNVYPNAVDMYQRVKNYLRPYNFELGVNSATEDFFSLRSKLFAFSSRSILIKEHKTDFAKIIDDFITKETPYNIARYNVFRRKAYDAELFSNLFTKEQALSLYQHIYNYDKSPYTLQQWALCLMAFKEYKDAFIKIDKAISESPTNFSFRNSQAIIMFESNKDIETTEAKSYMHKAMSILKDCYLDDKRKLYHAQKFAEFAIYFSEKIRCHDYLFDAKTWLNEVATSSEYISKYTKRLIEKITLLLSRI